MAKRVGYIEFIWAKGRMRLDVNFIPHTHYRVSGWLKERWVDMGVCRRLDETGLTQNQLH